MTVSKIVAAAASGAGSDPLDVDNLFKTYLYNGTGGNATITNGIDLSGNGGLVITKRRDTTYNWGWFDTVRGVNKAIHSNDTDAEETLSDNGVRSFNSDGFGIGDQAIVNSYTATDEIASFTFREQEKFFDIVQYTGNFTANTQIAHNLGSVPGMIIIKETSSVKDWYIYHRSLGNDNFQKFDTNGYFQNSYMFNATDPTSTHFTVGEATNTNANGQTYIAYLFAHNNNDGIFGPDEDQDIIKCGFYTGDSASQQINIGFEPQWIMVKNTSRASTNWGIFDTTRYWQNPAASGDSKYLNPNSNAAESGIARFYPTANGFGFTTENGTHMNNLNDTYIYCAIRKGSLFVPENASDVFDIDTMTGTSGNQGGFRSTFRVDFALDRTAVTGTGYIRPSARLTGTRRLTTSANDTESNQSAYEYDYMTGWYNQSSSDSSYYSWMWQRAPKFCDVVCWKGSGGARTLEHNLEVAPEMIWIKSRNLAENWCIYHSAIGNNKFLRLNSNASQISDTSATRFNHTSPTSGNFSVGSDNEVNGSGYYYVAYLFATLAGISKVGSYTGTGSSQTIDCGFTNGARFIIIKRANAAEDWLLHDSERGIISGSGDPYLTLNSSDSQLTSQNYVDPHSSGFTVPTGDSQTNNENDTYIFYAIAI